MLLKAVENTLLSFYDKKEDVAVRCNSSKSAQELWNSAKLEILRRFLNEVYSFINCDNLIVTKMALWILNCINFQIEIYLVRNNSSILHVAWNRHNYG